MTAETYTHTGLKTARRCLTEFDLTYNLKLASDADDGEALQVGQTWHKAFHEQHLGGDPYALISGVAPSGLWYEKLRRLFAAYAWKWESQEFEVIEAEHTFRTPFGGLVFEGQIDGIIEIEGRRGILERKTAGDDLSAESSYWERLRLDVQVGLYAIACGFVPSFILYDVVRKPTINPKNLAKKIVARMRAEIEESRFKQGGLATYYGETFTAAQLEGPLEEERESIELYGARLTADIGDRPDYYFARREVARTDQDYRTLIDNLSDQVKLLKLAQEQDLMHRNPDACATFGRCKFFGLCSNNIRPREGDPAPAGFHVREHLHPELASPSED